MDDTGKIDATDPTMVDTGPAVIAALEANAAVESAADPVEQVIISLKAVIGALDGPGRSLVIARLRAEFGG